MSNEFDLDGVVPWGRSYEEYASFFAITEPDQSARILDCGGGPSSFNVDMNQRGNRVVSIDPLYGLTKQTIEERVLDARERMMSGFASARDRFVWRCFDSPEASVAHRMRTMRAFLSDYEDGLSDERYIDAALPDLPFPNDSFDLVLSSHFLFLYDHLFDLDFHIDAMQDMLRVGLEARVFPLLDLNGRRSSLVDPVVAGLTERSFQVSLETVPYEFQRGGNQMMRVCRKPNSGKPGS